MQQKFRKRIGLFVLALLFWSTSAVAWEGTVVRVADGDTFQVRQGEQLVTIRLYGIDCPEHGQPFWREAKNEIGRLIQGKKVSVQPVEIDQYGRVVALVWIRGQLVNGDMVRRGLAWVYSHYCKSQPLCRDLDAMQQAARDAKLGLWSQSAPMPPWVWKHGKP